MYTCTQAAKDDNFDALVEAYNSKSLPDGDTIYYAAKSGNIEMLNFLYQKGYKPNIHCGYAAAGKGNIMILEWLCGKGCDLNYETAIFAIMADKLEGYDDLSDWQEKTLIVLEWLKSKNVNCRSSVVVKYAACVNNISALNWIKRNYDNVDYSYAKQMVMKGTKGAEWLDENT